MKLKSLDNNFRRSGIFSYSFFFGFYDKGFESEKSKIFSLHKQRDGTLHKNNPESTLSSNRSSQIIMIQGDETYNTSS